MNVEQITLGQIVASGTVLIALFGLIKGMINPIANLNNRIKKIELHQDNDNKRLDKLDNDTRQILLSVNVLLQHSIDNNHTDKLKERKLELDEYLINR